MEFVYILVGNNFDWEDMVIFLSKDEAIFVSRNNPTSRVEIFKKNELCFGYSPTYNYYLDGELINTRKTT